MGAHGRPDETLALLAHAAICAAPLGAPVLGDIFSLAAALGRQLGLDRLAGRAEKLAEAAR